MKKVYCLLLFCVVFACKKKSLNTISKPPNFYYKKTKEGISKDSLLFYLKELKKIPTNHLSDSLKAEYAYMSSRFNYKLQKHDEAISDLIYATSFASEKIKNNRELLYFRALYAMYFTIKNDYLNAAGINEKLNSLLDPTDYAKKAYVYSNKQQVKKALKKYEEALLASKKAATLYLKNKDTVNYLISVIDNATLYSSLSKPLKATQELNKVLPYEQLLNTKTKYQLYSAQGYAYNQKKEYHKAIVPYKKALFFSKKLSKQSGSQRLINTYLNLSTTYFKLNDYKNAEKYIGLIFDIGLVDVAFVDTKEILKTTLEIAYKQQEGIDIVMPKLDSLLLYLEKNYNSRINNELRVLQESYEKEKTLQLEKNKAEIKSIMLQRNQYLLLLLLLVIVALSIFVLNFYKQRRFTIEKQNFLLQQRLLRSQMNPHFIFNSLGLIKQGVENNKTHYANYIVKFSRLLRTVFDNSTKDYVPLEDELQSLQDYIELQQFRFPDRFNYTLKNNIVTANELHIPPMLLQPFVENTIIHGFGKLDCKGELDIEISCKKEYLVCVIDDNGVGFKKKKNPKESSINLINQFLTKMTGKEVLITNKLATTGKRGVSVELTIPYIEL
ncbi:histidine kinase [Tenacibaculum sp. FZY0031]|uniref:histidine kinase n=1 Tax=Tenacibaculum sp. FZY0031 TaxID=3116648 RepID=UPI002EC64AB1|nr:histidine kinase [Tenacibaculum sp. FZY0031]